MLTHRVSITANFRLGGGFLFYVRLLGFAAIGLYGPSLAAASNPLLQSLYATGILASEADTPAQSTFLPKAANRRMVVVESENYYQRKTAAGGETWQTVTDSTFVDGNPKSLVSAEKAMQVQPDAGRSYSSNIPSRSARLDYSVKFQESGDYYVWVRGKSPGSNSNSVHVGINSKLTASGTSITNSTASPVYEWISRSSATGSAARITVPSAGTHMVNVWMSKDGFIFDKLILTRDAGFLPELLGPTQSEQGQYRSYPVNAGATSLSWSFDENPAYGKATDSVKKVSMTCSACPAAETGLLGGAFRFNGVSSFEFRNSLVNFSSSQGFSVETFVRLDTSCSATQGIMGSKSPGSSYAWSINCENSKLVANITDSGGVGANIKLQSQSTVNDGRWHHIVLVRDGYYKENRLYIDGNLHDTKAVDFKNSFATDAPMTIGKAYVAKVPKFFYGSIDGLTISSRALRADEIRQAFKGKTGGFYQSMWGCEVPASIMPLGDSITAGTNGKATNLYGTYRTSLYDTLTAIGYNVDFTGSVHSRHTQDKDPDHEGWPGFSSYHIRNNTSAFLSMNKPDIILLHIGTNSLSSALAGTKEILNKVDLFSKKIPVVVAKIINQRTYNPAVHAYNLDLELMVKSRISNGDRLYLVDQEPVLNYTKDMFDNLHPTIAAASKMSTPWYNELITSMPRCRPAAPIIVSSLSLQGKRSTPFAFTPEVLGHPIGTFTLTAKPSGMLINATTGEIRWPAPVTGTHLVKVKVSNPNGSDTASFNLTVR